MAGANAEQLKAIEHTGGVLLKAGAGSGKTFVLKEHMIYLTDKWIREYLSSERTLDFAQVLKSKFSKIVLMTFTKKAAGEISIRLNGEFEAMLTSCSDEHRSYWQLACEQLDYLTVTTIHGFCFKLIKQGFFPEIDLDEDVISTAEYNEKMKDIFNRWVERELSSNENIEFVDLIIKDKEHILDSIKSIFSDPTLRRMWNTLDANGVDEDTSNKVVKDLLEIMGVTELFNESFDTVEYSEFAGKTWFDFLKNFEAIKCNVESLDDLLKMNEFFSNLNYKIPVTPRAKGIDEYAKSYYGLVKNLNTFLKSTGRDLKYYKDNFNTNIIPWFKKFKAIIDFVEIEYDKSSGITFSDLEYVVRMGLEKPEVVKAVSESYEYLIIDEFQDTSFIQFEIIQKIIGNDFNKLFCVGDIKQAIYGFRGGELGVFLQCEEMVPKVLSLKNNYRSDKNIVEFNNNFFDYLFKVGLKYDGADIRPVEVEYQEVPIQDRPEGSVYEITADLDFLANHGIAQISSNEMDYMESLSLFEQIKNLNNDELTSCENVCVLYKKLKPSLLLIGLFIEHDIGFTAQIKVPYGQDPILGMFKALLEKDFNLSELKNEYLKLILNSYFSLLDSSIKVDFSNLINQFEKDQHYFGLYRAFHTFISNTGIANSNYRNNLSQIKTLCKLGSDDKAHILSLLSKEESNAYSLDFQYGLNPSRVVIMTAHASKGLQYPHVLLGGIYTNDKAFPFTGLFGKMPMSFKWGNTITSKEKYKTPQFYLESEVRKHKDFSESKRLFYVAATRAEKSLGWVELNFGKVKKRNQSGSWFSGVSSWKKALYKVAPNIIKTMQSFNVTAEIDKVFSLKFLENSSNRKPLFHIDSLGITKKLIENKISILPELSVTRLATISQCPRKFYLKNICKINDSDLKIIQGDHADLEESNEEDLSSKSFKAGTSSSAQRGTRIHSIFEYLLKNNFELPEEITKKDSQVTAWAVDKLKNYRDNFEFISEQMIKFEVFNYMISGIPDLILMPKDNKDTAELWDFKTGSRKEGTEKPYEFQLMTYAYALYKLNLVPKNNPIKTVLCYVDDENLVEQTVTKTDVDKYLSNYWNMISTPDQINSDHCAECPYGNICHK
jgi:ATP-dependent exoDNAse (exonuclease V) beta subunit